MGPPKREPRPPQPGLSGPVDTEPQVASIVPDQADHRRRQVLRLAVIAQVRAARPGAWPCSASWSPSGTRRATMRRARTMRCWRSSTTAGWVRGWPSTRTSGPSASTTAWSWSQRSATRTAWRSRTCSCSASSNSASTARQSRFPAGPAPLVLSGCSPASVRFSRRTENRVGSGRVVQTVDPPPLHPHLNYAGR